MLSKIYLEIFIAIRYLRGNKRTVLFSTGMRLSYLFLSLMTFIMILVISVFSGFEKEIHNLLAKSGNHITVTGAVPGRNFENYNTIVNNIKESPELKPVIQDVFPLISANGLLDLGDRFEEKIIRAIPVTEDSDFRNFPRLVHFNSTLLEKMNTENYLLIGRKLARDHGYKIGDKVTLYIPRGGQMTREMQIKRIEYVIAGFFRTGFNEFDSGILYTSLQSLQRDTGLTNRATDIIIQLNNLNSLNYVREMIRDELPGNPYDYSIVTIKDERGNFLAAVHLEKTMMTIVLGMLIVAGAAGIWITVYLLIEEKKKSIGMLRAIGMPSSSIHAIFTANAFLIGTLAAFSGGVIGIFTTSNLEKIVKFTENTIFYSCTLLKQGCRPVHLIPEDIYYFDYLPVGADLSIVMGVSITTLVLSGLAGFLPTKQTTQIEASTAIREE